MATQVDGHNAALPGEVRDLWGEERAIARPPVYEHESGFACCAVFIGQGNPIMDDRCHGLFSFFLSCSWNTQARGCKTPNAKSVSERIGQRSHDVRPNPLYISHMPA